MWDQRVYVFGGQGYRSMTHIWSMEHRPTHSQSEFSNALIKSWMEGWHHICTRVSYEAMGNASVESP